MGVGGHVLEKLGVLGEQYMLDAVVFYCVLSVTPDIALISRDVPHVALGEVVVHVLFTHIVVQVRQVD